MNMIEESNKDLKICIAVRVSEDLGDVVASMVRKSFLEGKLSRCSESSAVNTIFKDVISSEKYWKLQNSILLHKDALVNKNTQGSSYITLSKKQIEDLSESLFHPLLRNRLKAMEYLIRCVSTDSSHVISFWKRLGLGLEENLTSSVGVISEASLQVYKKFLISSTPDVILQVYSSLLKVLSRTLHKDFCILSLPNIYLISDIVQLINRFQRNIMKFWFRFPMNVITGIVSKTFECYEKCQWLNEYGKNGLSHYLWLVDEHGLWLSSLLHSLISRQTVYKAVSKHYKFLWKLLETCHSYIEEVVFGPSTSSVIQSTSILLRLLEQKDGRDCLIHIFSETFVKMTDDLQVYSTLESIWTLLSAVCFSLFKSNEASSVVDLLCKVMQNQIETGFDSDKQLIIQVINKIQDESDCSYLCYVSECLSEVSKSLTARKFILQRISFNEITEELTKCVNSDRDVLQPATIEELKINYLNFLSNMLLEPLAMLSFSEHDFQEILYNIAKWFQNVYTEVLNLVVNMATNELGLYVLAQNPEFTEIFFQNFSAETLSSSKNFTQFCLQILSLQVTSLDRNEILEYLMKKLKGLADVCQDVDSNLWISCLNQHLTNIPYFSQAFLQAIQDTQRGCLHDISISEFLPTLLFNCQNCSELFELRVLNFLLYDLNIFLYLSLKVNIQESLLKQQEKNDNVIDKFSVLRNYILAQISVFGGSRERCLPAKKLSEYEKVEIIHDLSCVSKYILQSNNNLNPIFNDMPETSNVNEIRTKFEELICSRILSVNDCLCFVNLLVRNANDMPFEDGSTDDIPSEIDVHGITLALNYGKSQAWLSKEHTERDESSLLTLLRKTVASSKCFNFLAASVFLICGGNLQTSIEFMNLLDSSTNTELSVVALVNCFQDLNCNKYRGVLCSIFDLIVQEEMPSLYNVFLMVNLPPHKCLILWISQCFWNVLNMNEIASFLLLCIFHNSYFLIYACVALLNSLELELYEQFELQNVHLFLREYTPQSVFLHDYVTFMQDLDEKYCDLINRKLFI